VRLCLKLRGLLPSAVFDISSASRDFVQPTYTVSSESRAFWTQSDSPWEITSQIQSKSSWPEVSADGNNSTASAFVYLDQMIGRRRSTARQPDDTLRNTEICLLTLLLDFKLISPGLLIFS